ncbi:Hsp20/alpha crystallin family protein [Hymenobacter guriensis]|uniref:Hsp20/alpha crystallin family protein n=1 Tax=Hymenobacter guriensis TaxID=2793065 RepID=A0ABS0L6T7_9BACT|nr:Hsp20/alpha crystallin family protein [Hymenobacter guriensis]MBG8555238.1 Hsp20/alpha crystallin family protein [Hymenobacter guriensis]
MHTPFRIKKGTNPMKLISQEFIRNLVPQLDLLNTLGGGVAQATMRIDKREKGVVIRVAAPSVQPDNFHVVLNNQHLTVYGEYRHEPEAPLAAPLFVRSLDLPDTLDLTRIDAVHEGRELLVRIPYKDSTSHPREINIRHR